MERLFKGRKRQTCIDIALGLFILNLIIILAGILSIFGIYKITRFTSASSQKDRDDQASEIIVQLEKNLINFYISNYNIVSTDKIVRDEEIKSKYSNLSFDLHIDPQPKRVSFAKLSQKIEGILGDQKDKHGIYIYDFSREKEVEVNGEKVFPPASVSKIPLAINILQKVDDGEIRLADEVTIETNDYTYPSNILNYTNIGSTYKVEELLNWLIIDSDNISLRALERILGGNDVNNKMTRENLEVDPFFKDPHQANAKNVGVVLRGIYNLEYLEKDSNEFLIDRLQNTAYWLQDEIPAGLPSGITIAHKTGRVETIDGFAINDAGIIYGKDTDFVIVFLNTDLGIQDARNKIVEITNLVYRTLN